MCICHIQKEVLSEMMRFAKQPGTLDMYVKSNTCNKNI